MVGGGENDWQRAKRREVTFSCHYQIYRLHRVYEFPFWEGLNIKNMNYIFKCILTWDIMTSGFSFILM